MGNDNKIENKIEIPENTDTQEIELAKIREEKQQAELQEKSNNKKESEKSETKASAVLFLKKELNQLKSKSKENPYDLETEFAKTKKNRSPLIPLVLVFCTILVAAFIYGTYFFISKDKISVDLSDGLLEEVNAEDLADEVTRTTVMYENSLRNIESLKKSLEEKLAEAKKQYDFNLFVIDSMNIDDQKDVKSRKNAAKSENKKKVEEIHLEMDKKIQDAEKESENLKIRLENYEKQEVANKNQSEEKDEKDILASLERERIIRDYEQRILDLNKELSEVREKTQEEKKEAIETLSKKYQDEIAGLDPQLNDKNAKSIIADSKYLKNADFVISKYTDKADKVSDEKLRNVLRRSQSEYESYDYLYKTVKDIPQKYSIPEYVKTGNKLVVDATNNIVETAVESVNSLSDSYNAEKNERIIMQDAVLSLISKEGKKCIVLQTFQDKLRLFVTNDVDSQLKKGEKEAFVMLNGKKVSGKVYKKDEIVYFEPNATDISEEIKDLNVVSVGTEVKFEE